MFKKLLLIGLLAVGLMPTVNATIVSTNVAAAGKFVLLSSGGKVIDYITVVSVGTNGLFYLYDWNSTTTTYTNAAYSYKYPTNSTVVTTFIGPTGMTNNYTNSVMTWATNSISAATNSLTPISAFAGPADVVATIPDTLILTKGLVISNTAAATVIVSYRDQ